MARLPLPMTGIGIITLLSQLRGSYALAGAVSATFVLTYALLSPQVSRWVDRRGQNKVLPWATAASAAGLLLLPACTLLAAPDWMLFIAAMLCGCMPSVSAMVRARWTAIHRGRPLLQTAYSLETVFDEVTFIAGPPLSVGLSVAVWPQAGVLAAALLLVLGVTALVLQRGTEPPLQPCERHPVRSLLRQPEIRLLALLMLAMGMIVGTVDITSVAFAEQRGQPLAASAVLSAYALGSCAAGLLFGARTLQIPLPRLLLTGAAATALATVPLLWVGSLPALALAVLLAGVFFAPTMIVAMSLVEQHVPESRLTEGMTWLLAGLNIGVALGAALSGQSVDAGCARRFCGGAGGRRRRAAVRRARAACAAPVCRVQISRRHHPVSASSPAHPASAARHRWWAVSAVGLATFSVVTTEMLPVGLLTPVAEDLGASTGTAGLLISLPALLAAVFAPLVVIAAGGIDRRRILCALLGLLLVANLASALAPGIGWLLAARVLVGFCMGGIWAIAGGLAARLVPAQRIGLATSIIFGGVAAASVLGVPLGVLIGDAWGWRSAFIAMALFSAAVMLLHVWVVPALPVSTSVRHGSSQQLPAAADIPVGRGRVTAHCCLRPRRRQLPGRATGSTPSTRHAAGHRVQPAADACAVPVDGKYTGRWQRVDAGVGPGLWRRVGRSDGLDDESGAAGRGDRHRAVRGVFNIGIALGAWGGGRLLDGIGLHATLWAAAMLAGSALLMVATTRR